MFTSERKKEGMRDLHQYDDPVGCVVELGAAVDQTHLKSKLQILILSSFLTVCIRGANKGRTSAKSAASKAWILTNGLTFCNI